MARLTREVALERVNVIQRALGLAEMKPLPSVPMFVILDQLRSAERQIKAVVRKVPAKVRRELVKVTKC